MKRLALSLTILLVAAPAGAVQTYDIGNMTCSQVQSILKRDGVAQLRYNSKSNPSLPIYNRYVSGSTFCSSRSIANLATVPTRDNPSCRVKICKRFGDR
ncbi:hypothetical protein [Hoeflea prorocentri]|uniref:KTSC domain-containing protein n=1 Tax=Hoeflea prorocentri TaxID=1922333 RepID=A0A9X3UGI4_9HYPH|nr:hypothetical protein [Hoeflea prorocentri]MCY6380246.1 hypothetical protein [Hoeflea prorocentri]MDA5398046.1 hypothetical protein [Hoeflea prorocentri]